MSTICDCGGIIDLDDTLAQTSHDLFGKHEHLEQLTFAPGARELVARYGHYLALVTAGEGNWQMSKLRHLGLFGRFRETHIVERPEDKGKVIRQIVNRWEIPPNRLIVIGDRPDVEIAAGNSLGILTVRIVLPGGKYSLVEPEEGERPTYTVTDLWRVRGIMETIMFFE